MNLREQVLRAVGSQNRLGFAVGCFAFTHLNALSYTIGQQMGGKLKPV